jgi:general secretion pathway protein D
VLTNPEVSMILHLIEQKGNADLLSAPRVTAKAGQEATIKVVTEYIYPTEFNVEPITAGADANARIVGGIVEPGAFETREVGVLLSVVPDVSPEGQIINLTITPEVVSEPIWHQYGSTYVDSDGNTQQLNMEQPFFHTRTVTTQIAIYNGATVVMGGMINELRTDVDDKIPFLGDIPLLGRLFQSRYEQSEKRNLLIFVTARLVDPAGRPIMRKDVNLAKPGAAGAGGGGTAPAAAP